MTNRLIIIFDLEKCEKLVCIGLLIYVYLERYKGQRIRDIEKEKNRAEQRKEKMYGES